MSETGYKSCKRRCPICFTPYKIHSPNTCHNVKMGVTTEKSIN